VVTTQLTEYFNGLLKSKGFELSRRGENHFSMLIGEVIDNAEQHSHKNNWFVAGYMSENNVDGYGECSIAIFDFGSTIHKSLSEAELDESLRENINKLILNHTKRRYFSLEKRWTEENLWTLFALQEGISRYNVRGETSRGHGTVNMIEFFLKLGGTNAIKTRSKMALISGNTYILFDGTHKLRTVNIDGEKRQIIAFNDENDLAERPQQEFVKHLSGKFPGTMIVMKFYLEKAFLESIHPKESEVQDES
jgi:hypothetical protein